jgi:16S rRNA (guanine527-N7)-methyltransferase
MNPARIAQLLEPFFAGHARGEAATGENISPLSAKQLEQISMYIDLLLRWNARVNLTAIRTAEEIVTRHFGESLFAARNLPPTGIGEPGTASVSSHGRLIDVGSGAGFPGIAIQIWSPATPVTLIESNQKKVAFLREVMRTITLTDINVFSSRAEDHPPAVASIVTLRAVERFDKILPSAARLLTVPGTLALLIGSAQLSQAQRVLPSFSWSKPAPIPLSSNRILVCAERSK